MGALYDVRLKTVSNDCSTTPISCAIRVDYDSSATLFVSSIDGDLGAVSVGAEQGAAPNNYRVVTTAGNPTSTNLLPALFTLRFQAQPGARPYAISMQDASTGVPLLKKGTLTENIAHTISNTELAALGCPAVPIVAELVGGSSADTLTPGAQFELLYNATLPNDCGSTPTASTMRINYDSASAQYVSVTDGDLGVVSVGAEQGTAPNNYRVVSTAGNPAANSLTPALFKLRFQVQPSPSHPYSLSLQDDPSGVALLKKGTLSENIPHLYDNLASAKLGCRPVPIVTELIGGSGTNTRTSWALYDVRVKAASINDCESIPTSCAIQVNYDSTSVAYVSSAVGNLGAVSVGPLQGVAPNNYRIVTTAGNPGASGLLPTLFTLKFQVQLTPNRPYDIILQDAPSGVPLLKKGTTTEDIPHEFISTETEGLGLIPSEVQEWLE